MGSKADAVQAEFDAFKQQVRAEALRVQREMSWCDSGLNETLSRLGLPQKTDVRVPVRLIEVPRQPRVETVSLLVPDAESAEHARTLLADREELTRRIRRAFGSYWEPELLQPAPTDGTGVPVVGEERPAEGTWYATSAAPGGPNQCRVVDEQTGVYCTRPLAHPADVHVAAGNSAGVLAVWEASPGDVRPDPHADYDDPEDDDAYHGED